MCVVGLDLSAEALVTGMHNSLQVGLVMVDSPLMIFHIIGDGWVLDTKRTLDQLIRLVAAESVAQDHGHKGLGHFKVSYVVITGLIVASSALVYAWTPAHDATFYGLDSSTPVVYINFISIQLLDRFVPITGGRRQVQWITLTHGISKSILCPVSNAAWRRMGYIAGDRPSLPTPI